MVVNPSSETGIEIEPDLPREHSAFIRFLGAVDGKVVPSGAILMVPDKMRHRFYTILNDAGSAMREETPEGKYMEALHFPADVDTIVITHPHTDHCGDLPRAAKRNPHAKIFAPDGNKDAIRIIVQEAYKRRKDRDALKAIDDWRKNATELLKKMFSLEGQTGKGIKRGKSGRNEITITHEKKRQMHQQVELELELVESTLWHELGLTRDSVKELAEFLEDPHINKHGYEITYRDFERAIEKRCGRQMVELGYQGILSPKDVEESLARLTELPFRTRHKIGTILRKKGKEYPITLQLNPSGHTQTVESGQAYYEVPTGKGGKIGVLFSGDRGNSQFKAPYAQADDRGLEDSADVLVLESTYGDRIHGNREEALQKLDSLICEAIQNGEDIIFPIISLDRPMMVMYEIVTRLFARDPSLAEKVDIYHFGKMIDNLLVVAKKRKHPMEKEIRKFWKNFVVDAKKSQLKPLVKKGKKSRIFFAGGGFVPREGSPAGAIMDYALLQDDLSIMSANYHGDVGSNGHNLFNGKEFQTTKENPTPRRLSQGQKAHFIPGFSGHEDASGLVAYARKVIRKGGTIYLNHGSEEARQALYLRLTGDPIIKKKNVKVILPISNKNYVIKSSGTDNHDTDKTPQPPWNKRHTTGKLPIHTGRQNNHGASFGKHRGFSKERKSKR